MEKFYCGSKFNRFIIRVIYAEIFFLYFCFSSLGFLFILNLQRVILAFYSDDAFMSFSTSNKSSIIIIKFCCLLFLWVHLFFLSVLDFLRVQLNLMHRILTYHQYFIFLQFFMDIITVLMTSLIFFNFENSSAIFIKIINWYYHRIIEN